MISVDKRYLSEANRAQEFCYVLAHHLAALCVVAVLTGCVTVTSTPPVMVDANKNWALLPLINLSSTPRAEGQLGMLVETALRSRGVRNIDIYSQDQQPGLRSLFDDSAQLHVARQWARESDQHYALSGSVHEWQYRSGADKEPTVGMTLKLSDVKTGQVLWQGNAARTGIGFTNLQSIASELVDELLGQITIATSR